MSLPSFQDDVVESVRCSSDSVDALMLQSRSTLKDSFVDEDKLVFPAEQLFDLSETRPTELNLSNFLGELHRDWDEDHQNAWGDDRSFYNGPSGDGVDDIDDDPVLLYMLQRKADLNKTELLMHWLAAPNLAVNHNRALQQRCEGTGLWILENASFAYWKSTPNSFLWLNGVPGCGKTVLSSIIVENIQSQGIENHVPLYFYFGLNDESRMSLENLVRALIGQIYERCEDSKDDLETLFSSCKNGSQQPNTELFIQTLHAMIGRCKELTIVLDALDEAATPKAVLKWIESLFLIKHPKLHVLVTSREQEEINSIIRRRHSDEEVVFVKTDDVNPDIRSYIRARVQGDGEFIRWTSRPDVHHEIETKLMEKANGM